MAQKRLDKELRKMANTANRRLRQFEKLGLKSPAYEAVQAKLEMLGIKQSGDKGRRFPETGKATYTQNLQYKKVLREFLKSATGTVRGYKKTFNQVWNTADQKYNLKDSGISKDDYLEFWKNQPQNERDRLFGSEILIELLEAYTWKKSQRKGRKGRKKKRDNDYTIEEISKRINESNSYKEALKNIGLTNKDILDYEESNDLL